MTADELVDLARHYPETGRRAIADALERSYQDGVNDFKSALALSEFSAIVWHVSRWLPEAKAKRIAAG